MLPEVRLTVGVTVDSLKKLEERLGNEILWGKRALESSDIFLGIYKLLSCSGLCICSEKTQESPRVPLLADLEEMCKQEVKAVIRHSCKLPS